MSEIIVPKFPPSWEAWGDWCCCEAIMSSKQICCDGDFWFIAETGRVGTLFTADQAIHDVGSINSYGYFNCCGDYAAILGIGSSSVVPVTVWYKYQAIFDGTFSYTYNHCIGNYFVSPRIAWYKGRTVFEATGERDIYGRGFDDYLLIVGQSSNDVILMYKGVQIFQGQAYTSPYGSGEYLYLTASNRATASLWYKGILIDAGIYSNYFMPCNDYFMTGPVKNAYGGFRVWYKGQEIHTENGYHIDNYCGNEFFVLSTRPGSTGTTTTKAWYNGEKIFDAASLSVLCQGDILAIQTSDGTTIVWYKSDRVYEGDFYADNICLDYVTLRGTNGNAIVFHKGVQVYEGPCYNYYCVTDGNGYIIRPTSTTVVAFYDGEIVAEGEYGAEITIDGTRNILAWRGDFLLLTYASGSMYRIWYKTKQIYDGPVGIRAETYGENTYYYPDYRRCGDLLVIHPSASSTIVFYEDKQVEYEQEKHIDYICCGGRAYIADDETIDIWDADFGKMKFDINTFDRIA